MQIRCGFGHSKLSQYLPSFTTSRIEELTPFEKLSLGWFANIATFKRLVQQGMQIYSVKFEDLIQDPEMIVKKVFGYFEISINQMPDVKEVMNKDSQRGSLYTSRKSDDLKLRNRLTPLTDYLKNKFVGLGDEFGFQLSWDKPFVLEKDIKTLE